MNGVGVVTLQHTSFSSSDDDANITSLSWLKQSRTPPDWLGAMKCTRGVNSLYLNAGYRHFMYFLNHFYNKNTDDVYVYSI